MIPGDTPLQGRLRLKRDYYAGALMLVLGVGAAVIGSGYKVGTLARMGPGFMPVILGVTLAWQLAYLVIASDPLRYRPLMLVAVFAKWSFVVAVAMLYWQGRVAGPVLGFASVDLYTVTLPLGAV